MDHVNAIDLRPGGEGVPPIVGYTGRFRLPCEQAHLVCYSHEYLGGGSRAGEKNGVSKSEPARKPLNFEFSAFVHERSILIGLK